MKLNGKIKTLLLATTLGFGSLKAQKSIYFQDDAGSEVSLNLGKQLGLSAAYNSLTNKPGAYVFGGLPKANQNKTESLKFFRMGLLPQVMGGITPYALTEKKINVSAFLNRENYNETKYGLAEIGDKFPELEGHTEYTQIFGSELMWRRQNNKSSRENGKLILGATNDPSPFADETRARDTIKPRVVASAHHHYTSQKIPLNVSTNVNLSDISTIHNVVNYTPFQIGDSPDDMMIWDVGAINSIGIKNTFERNAQTSVASKHTLYTSLVMRSDLMDTKAKAFYSVNNYNGLENSYGAQIGLGLNKRIVSNNKTKQSLTAHISGDLGFVRNGKVVSRASGKDSYVHLTSQAHIGLKYNL